MSRKETYDGETKSGKEDEHLRRLREFKKRQKSGLFSKDFDEEARYFVDHQLKKIGKSYIKNTISSEDYRPKAATRMV